MKLVKAWEEKGANVPEPYRRTIKVLFAPDKEDVPEIKFNIALLPPGGKTDYHKHDRPELIYVVSGQGVCIDHEGKKIPITADMAIWAETGEMHQIINTGYEILKLTALFVPGFPAADTYKRCLDAAK